MSNGIYTLEEIAGIIAPIAARYGVDRIAIKGLFALGGLYADLEEALGKELDMITVKSLKYNDDDSFKNNLEKERVLIYEAA